MPKYIMPNATAPEFRALDEFTRGYIEALFFTNSGPEDDQLGDAGFSELAPETLQRIVADCVAFQHGAVTLLEQAYSRDYDATQAGRDFWFTRCEHGVGYWDREALDDQSLGEALSDAASKHGNVDPYLGDDGKIYLG